MPKKDKHPKSGFTCEMECGAIYHFERIARREADERARIREELFVVETINWRLAEGGKAVRLHKYLTIGLGGAISLAAGLEIASINVAEQVVALRLATQKEVKDYLSACEHFERLMPPVLNDEELVRPVSPRK